MNVTSEQSKKGINYLTIDSPSSNMVTLQFWFRAGSSLERPNQRGIAHFLEHMFFKGSKKYPDMKIAKTIERFGGEINAFTSFDYTCYYINAPWKKGLKALDVLLDMVCNPQFKKQDLIPERQVVLEEYLRSIDSPSQFNFYQVQDNVFNKGYQHKILGNPSSILNFDLRQLKEFRKDNYCKENALVVIAGNLGKTEKYSELIEKYSLPSGKKSSFPLFKLKSKSNFDIHYKSVNQMTLTFVIEAPQFTDENAVTEDLALNTISFGDISRLYKYFVEETSLANGFSGSTMFFSKGGCHFLKIAFPPENLKRILTEFPIQIKKLLKNPIEQIDLERIRNQYMASKVYEKESIESFAFNLGHGFAQNEDIYSDENYIKSMQDISVADINESLADIFSRKIHIVLQAPQEYEGKLDKKILTKLSQEISTEKAKVSSNKLGKVTVSKFDPATKVITLAPGLKLIHRHNPLASTFVLHSFIKGGLSNENKNNNGIYNLLSKNITYGYEDLNYDQIKSDLELKASYLNGFSGRNAYGLNLHGLSDYTDDLLDHFFGTLLKPNFDPFKFEIEKELVKRSMHLQKEDPLKICFRQFSQLVFHGHSYSLDMIGSEKSIEQINVEKLKRLHKKSLQQEEMVLTYCGNLSLSTVEGKIKPRIKTLFNRKIKSKTNHVPKPKTDQNVHKELDREQSHIIIGKAAFASNTSEDLYLKIFTALLSGQSSDLFVKVRDEMGLCYSVQTIHNSSLEAGYWAIYIGTSHEKEKSAIEAVKGIIHKYQSKGLSKAELSMVKSMVVGQNQIATQTNDDYAYFYSVPVLHGLGLDYPHNIIEKLEKIELPKLNAFLKKFLKDDWNTVSVGPS